MNRTEVLATIAAAESIENPGRYARARTESAREHLARHDARPYWWTAEHYRIALRDAANAARLAIRYAHD